MPRFGRVLSAMVTPFDEGGALDLDVAAELARWLQAHGHDGIVVAGTTGEAPTLDDDEHLSLVAAVVEAVDIPVIAGTGGNDTRHSIYMTREAAALGVAGVLTVCPYYNRPSQAGIAGHVRAMAAATSPPRSGPWSTFSLKSSAARLGGCRRYTEEARFDVCVTEGWASLRHGQPEKPPNFQMGSSHHVSSS